MIRRRLTLKRVDPWSVLKFGFMVNIAIMLVALLGFWILWIVIGRLGLVDQFCDSVGSIVLDLEECSLNGGNIFRTLLFLGVLGVVVQTGIMVFGAFLYNLIADLTGGLGFSFLDESADAGATVNRSTTTGSFQTGASERDATGSRTGAAAGAAASAAAASSGTGSPPNTGGPPDQSSSPRRPTPDGPPPAPSTGPETARPDATRPTPSSASPSAPSRPDSSTSAPTSAPTTPTSPSTGRPDGDPPRRADGSSGSSLWGDPGRSDDRG